MAYLLDTNVLSELRNRKRCDPNVKKWQEGVALRDSFVSVVSFMEIEKGILKVRVKDVEFSDILTEWFVNEVKTTFLERTYPVNAKIAEEAGKILASRSRSVEDALIAATAKVLGLTLITRNVDDFDDIEELTLINPWEKLA